MPDEPELRRTPLHDRHVALGAKMTSFAGFSMPVQYSGIVDEHRSVRKAAGLFDVSHMGEVIVHGPEALPFIQQLVTNDAGALYDGRAMYTVMCTENGGVVDDLLVYRLIQNRYMLVINAASTPKDVAWILERGRQYDVEIEDSSDRTALIALQGPATRQIIEKVQPQGPLGDLKSYHFAADIEFAGVPGVLLSRTGYTGEYGVEIYCSSNDAPAIWDALMEAGEPEGMLPAGLGARDTLRLESGFPLYGNELDETTNPIEAGLSWLVKFEKGDFMGRSALSVVRRDGPSRRLVGFVMEERGIPRSGYELISDGQRVGVVTSGTQSPMLQKGIGLGYVPNHPHLTASNSSIAVSVRGRTLAARVASPPFHKN